MLTPVAIAGAAESDIGKVEDGLTPTDLMVQASLRALEDCGLQIADVDGLFAATTQLPMATLNLGEQLGVRPRYTDATQIGGSSPIAHIDHARAAISAGLCDVALIAYGSTQRSVGRGNASVQEIDLMECGGRRGRYSRISGVLRTHGQHADGQHGHRHR